MPCPERHLARENCMTEPINIQSETETIKIENQYWIGSTIGEGAYSKVKKAYDKTQNRNVAIKIINCQTAPKNYKEKFLYRELKILKMVCHPNIVELYEILCYKGKVKTTFCYPAIFGKVCIVE